MTAGVVGIGGFVLPRTLSMLTDWQTFYVITGSASAGLTGLMFVVITLTAETRRAQSTEALNAFATPSVVHFGAVLLISALLSTPGHTTFSLAVCLSLCGVIGMAYSVRVIIRIWRQNEYTPVLSDWLWYMMLPVVGYACLLGAAALLERHTLLALYTVGAISLLLLYVGMHNAWDTAMWMAIHPHKPQVEPDAGKDG